MGARRVSLPGVGERQPEEQKPFRLEGEEEQTSAGAPYPPAPPRPAPPPPSPAAARAPPPPPPPTPPAPERTPVPRTRRPRPDENRREVSTLTVREKGGDTFRATPGPVPPPRHWPSEAAIYPFRRWGLSLLGAGILFALADWLTAFNAFLGGLAKVFLYAFLFLWTVRAVATTAGGHDRPPPLTSVMNLDPDGLAGLLQFLVTLLLYLAPAGYFLVKPILVDPKHPVWDGSTQATIAALLAFALLAAPIVVLGHALSLRKMAWPWRAVVWVVRGLPTCLLVTLSWAACVGAEWFVSVRAHEKPEEALPIYLGLRLANFYVVWVAARALGVLGRRLSV